MSDDVYDDEPSAMDELIGAVAHPDPYSPLDDTDKLAFELLGQLLAGQLPGNDPGLLRVQFQGRDMAAIVAVTSDGGSFGLRPLALIVDAELFDQLGPGPEAEVVTEGPGDPYCALHGCRFDPTVGCPECVAQAGTNE